MQQKPIEVGSQRQLLLDHFFFAGQDNVKLTLHPPALREVVLTCERPWEQKLLHYSCVLQDGDRFRLWYRVTEGELGRDVGADRTWQCYAESVDGVRWEKPNLGLVAWQGSRENNIALPVEGVQGGNASVIRDPNAATDEPYKMITRAGAIYGYASSDALRWRPVETNPLLTEGPFDSHNILLWDDERRRYVIYLRGIDRSAPGPFGGGRRAIRRSESTDFLHWSKPEMVVAPDKDDPPNLHLYTNAAVKYFRAARAYFMFPMILYPDRRHHADAPYDGLSDIQFLFSRDGIHWDRRFRQPFISPGLDERNWVDRNPIMGVGLLPTSPTELSLYYSECYRSPASRLRRATVRTDGFVSVEGPYVGWGEFTTHPLLFTGKRLELNHSASGGGSLFVELQDEAGKPISGFALADCGEIVGDKIEGIVRWRGGEDVSALAGKPVRLRVRLRDAHLYAFRFRG